MSARVDGILASVAKETSDFGHFRNLLDRLHIPLVIFDRTTDEMKAPCVVIDDYKGAFIATQHLIENGYKRIDPVSGPQYIKCFQDRLNGYSDALATNKMAIDKN
ncbi:MAG: substrate-binding domain-containing protein [Ferruginibacter sp.]